MNTVYAQWSPDHSHNDSRHDSFGTLLDELCLVQENDLLVRPEITGWSRDPLARYRPTLELHAGIEQAMAGRPLRIWSNGINIGDEYEQADDELIAVKATFSDIDVVERLVNADRQNKLDGDLVSDIGCRVTNVSIAFHGNKYPVVVANAFLPLIEIQSLRYHPVDAPKAS